MYISATRALETSLGTTVQGIENTAFEGSKGSELEVWVSLGIRESLVCLGFSKRLGVEGFEGV